MPYRADLDLAPVSTTSAGQTAEITNSDWREQLPVLGGRGSSRLPLPLGYNRV